MSYYITQLIMQKYLHFLSACQPVCMHYIYPAHKYPVLIQADIKITKSALGSETTKVKQVKSTLILLFLLSL